MNDDALILHHQHTLNTQNIENKITIENSESSSSFRSFDFDSNSVLEQLLCFSPVTSVQNSDSDPEYLPSKKTCKSGDRPKSTCRRSARLSTCKDENATNLLSLPLTPSEDPEYFPPKGILYALKKSVTDSSPKSDIIINVKQRKLRRSKKIVDPACNNCNSHSNQNLSESYSNTVQTLPDLDMNNSPFSTEQLRQILEDTACEEVPKEATSRKGSCTSEDPKVQLEEVISHDSKDKEDASKDTTLKMPRTRASLKLKVKKKDKKMNISISDTDRSNKECNSEVSVTNSQNKVSKDKVLPKSHFHKENKKVLKRRKRQTCRKQFRHKDITLYKLGADPDPVNEATQKNHVIHKIFLRRSSVSAPQVTAQTPKVNKNAEVSDNLLSNVNISNDNQCSGNLTVKESNSYKNNSSNYDLSNSNKFYCSSISIENHSMDKVPKVILTPISTTDNSYQKSATLKDQDINANFKNNPASQDKPNRQEIGKHNLPIRIPERRTSIAEPLRTPPVPNNKVPSFTADFTSENQINYMKIEINKGHIDNKNVIYVKPPISQDKTAYVRNAQEDHTPPTALVPSLISKDLHNENVQSSIHVSKSKVAAIQNGNIQVTNDTNDIANNLCNVEPTRSRENDEQTEVHRNVSQNNIVMREGVNISNGKFSYSRGNREQIETFKSPSQETREASTCAGPQNLSIKVVKSCSGITDPLKLHKPNNLPIKKIDGDGKNRRTSATPPKENHNIHQRPEDPNCSTAQTVAPVPSNQSPLRSSSILQRNLLNGPSLKSDLYRNSLHNRSNIPVDNFNSEVPSYALNSLAISNIRTPHSNTVSNVSRNMPIIEETNQQLLNDKVTYDTSTSPFATDSSKRNRNGKRKLSRSDLYEEGSPKLQRSNNYPNYPTYSYPLSFFTGTSPNPTYNPLPPFSLGMPHSTYNMAPPLYQASGNTGQSSAFDRAAFRNIPPPPIINPFLPHEPRLPVSTYSPPNPAPSKTYDSRMQYNHLMRFSNPMFINHNVLPPDYSSSIGINNRRNETSPQNSKSVLQQNYDFSTKNLIKNTRLSPHEIFSFSENTHRRSTETAEPQKTPLALIKNAAPTQCNAWSNIPIVSRNDELTITKLPLRDNVPKPTYTLTSQQNCSPANQMEDLTALSKPSSVSQSGNNSCSAISISKPNIKSTQSSGYPSSKISVPERRSGVGSVLHGELANVSISIIKNKTEKHDKPTSLLQQGLLPILERPKSLQEKQPISILQTTKPGEINRRHSYPATIENIEPVTTVSIQKNDSKVDVTTSEALTDEKSESPSSSNGKTAPSDKTYHDIALEIDCAKIMKPVKSIANNQTDHGSNNVINSKTSIDSIFSDFCNAAIPKQENKISSVISTLNHKVGESSSAFSNSGNNEKANIKPENEKSLLVATTVLSTESELSSPNKIDKTAAINLSIEKPSKASSATPYSQTQSIVTSETTSRPVTSGPKSSNVNTIANIMQDIIHQGDVKKFDKYVETLRRSLENREIHQLDVIKQSCPVQFLERVVDATRTNYAENAANRSEHVNAASENIAISVHSSELHSNMALKAITTSEDVKLQGAASPSSENIAISETVEDLTETAVPLSSLESENGHTRVSHSTNVVGSKCIEGTEQAVEIDSPMLCKPVEFKRNIVSSNVVSDPCAVPLKDSNRDIYKNEDVITAEETDYSENKRTTAYEPNIQVFQTVEISTNRITETDKNTDDSSEGIVAKGIQALKHTNSQTVAKNTKEIRTITDSQSTVATQSVSASSVNCENSDIQKSAVSTNTRDSQCVSSESANANILSSLITENSTAMTEPLAIEIKKEIDDDDDVIIVYDPYERFTTLKEDKGIQADFPTLSPLNVNSNYLRARAPKRKKWKFLETNKSTNVTKINKMRLHKKQKRKTAFNARNLTKGALLSKQFRNSKLEVTKNTTTCKNEQNRCRKSQSQNTKTKTIKSRKVSAATSIKSYQIANSTFSVGSYQMDKPALISSAKLRHTVNNKVFDGGSYMPKTPIAASTEPYETDKSKSFDVCSKPSETSTSTATTVTTTDNIKLCNDLSQIFKDSTTAFTKSCQTTKNKLSGDDSQISKSSNSTLTKSVINKLSEKSYHVTSKIPKNDSITKRSSKRLLLKQGMKTYTNKNMEARHTQCKSENVKLFSSSIPITSCESEKLSQSQSCVVTPSTLHTPPVQNINYMLRNSEIIQNRCFVRLSRIEDNFKGNINQTSDSKNSIDHEKEKFLNKVSKTGASAIQPISDLLQTTQDIQSLNAASSTPFGNKSGKSKNNIANYTTPQGQEQSSLLTTTSSYSSNTPKTENRNNRTENKIRIINYSPQEPKESSSLTTTCSRSSNTPKIEMRRNQTGSSTEILESSNTSDSENIINRTSCSTDRFERSSTSKSEYISNLTGSFTEQFAHSSTSNSEIINDRTCSSTETLESSSTSKTENISDRTSNSFEILKNTPRSLPNTNKGISAVQIPQTCYSKKTSAQNIDDRVNSNNQAVGSVIQTPQKLPPITKLSQQILTTSPPPLTNNPVEVVQNSPNSFKIPPQLTKIISRNDKNQTNNHAAETLQKIPFVKKMSNPLADSYSRNITDSIQSTNNQMKMPHMSLSPSAPVTDASHKHQSFPSSQFKQTSQPLHELPKETFIDTCRFGGNTSENVNHSVEKVSAFKQISEETTNTVSVCGMTNNNRHSEKNLVQESSKLSEETNLNKTSSKKTTNHSKQMPQKISPSKIADTSSTKGLSTDNWTINSSTQIARQWAALTELLENTSNENNYNHINNYCTTQQYSSGRTSSQISDISPTNYKDTNNDTHSSSKSSQATQQSNSARMLPQIVATPTVSMENRVNNSAQVQSPQMPRFSPNMSRSVNSRNQTIDKLLEVPQKLLAVTKTPSTVSDIIRNSMIKSIESCRRRAAAMNNSIEVPQKSASLTNTLPRTPTTYTSTQIPTDPLSKIMHSSNTVYYSGEMSHKPPILITTVQDSNVVNNTVTLSQTSPSLNKIPSQISANNSVKTSERSPSLNKQLLQDSNASSATYKYINRETSNKSATVPQKSPNKTLSQPFGASTDFYRYGYNGYEIGSNANSVAAYTRSLSQLASASSANNIPAQIPQETTCVGRTSYQISKIPQMRSHRRTSNNNQMLQQPPLSNTIPSGLPDVYSYGTRNVDCEIDLTVSSKSTSRKDISIRPLTEKVPKTQSPKTPNYNLSKYEQENRYKSVSSDTMANTYQPYVGLQQSPRFYSAYSQKNSEFSPHTEFGQKIQAAEHPQISLPANKEMRHNSSSSTSSYNSQFSPTFTQHPPTSNNFFPKTGIPKQVTETKNKDLGIRYSNTALRHVPYSNSAQSLEQLREIHRPPSSGAAPVFTMPKESYVPLSKSTESGPEQSPETNVPTVSHKKKSKEDQNYLNVKASGVHHFNGNLSPDYGYFSPLTRKPPPSYESVVYRPNPTRYNEANSFHNVKYSGLTTGPQLNTTETYHHANTTVPIKSNANSSTNTYINQNSKLPVHTPNIPTVNGVQHKVQQPDVDKISSILPKLQQQETLNPEQYVLEMSTLEKDGCPRPFLEFYSFVTKKQIASNQLPISFRIFLEFHNAGKLKNFENAFRVYSERHEKEKKLTVNST